MTRLADDDRPLKGGIERLLPPRCRECSAPATSFCEGWLCDPCYKRTHARDKVTGALLHGRRGDHLPTLGTLAQDLRELWP